MAESSLILLADAVVETLKAGDFTPEFEPVRKLLPVYDLPELAALTVVVVPGGLSFDLITRGPTSTDDLIIDVAVIQNVKAPEDDVPTLLATVEAIAFHLKNNRRTAVATLMRIENQPIYGVKELREKNQFISVLRCFFRRVN